jgi:hypothetical protein
MIKRDLLTNEEYFANRSTQRFKNSENRIKYWNDKAKNFRQSIASTTKPLQNNIRILEELMVGMDECIFHREFLLGKSYCLNTYSSIVLYQKKEHFAIHNYLVIPISDFKIKFIKYKK